MLTLQDLMDFRDLDDETGNVAAPDVSMVSAAELGQKLLGTPEGLLQLHGMMLDNMRHALVNGQKEHLANVTKTFLDFHENFTLPFLGKPISA